MNNAQIGELFEIDRSVVERHARRNKQLIFEESALRDGCRNGDRMTPKLHGSDAMAVLHQGKVLSSSGAYTVWIDGDKHMKASLWAMPGEVTQTDFVSFVYNRAWEVADTVENLRRHKYDPRPNPTH